MTSFRRAALWVAASICLSLSLSTSLFAQRADRGTISGVVTDGQGSAVPGANVTIHNEATGLDTVLVTNASGAYTSPPLVLGPTRSPSTCMDSRRRSLAGILLEGGDAIRHDVVLQVGGLNETVEVRSETGSTSPAGRQPHGEREVPIAICQSSRPGTCVLPSPSCRCSPAICR